MRSSSLNALAVILLSDSSSLLQALKGVDAAGRRRPDIMIVDDLGAEVPLIEGELGEMDGRVMIIDDQEAFMAGRVGGRRSARMYDNLAALAMLQCVEADLHILEPLAYMELPRPANTWKQDSLKSKPKHARKQHIRATMRSVNRNR